MGILASEAINTSLDAAKEWRRHTSIKGTDTETDLSYQRVLRTQFDVLRESVLAINKAIGDIRSPELLRQMQGDTRSRMSLVIELASAASDIVRLGEFESALLDSDKAVCLGNQWERSWVRIVFHYGLLAALTGESTPLEHECYFCLDQQLQEYRADYVHAELQIELSRVENQLCEVKSQPLGGLGNNSEFEDFLGLQFDDKDRIVTRNGHAPFKVDLSNKQDQWELLKLLFVKRSEGASKNEIMRRFGLNAEAAKKLRQRLIETLSPISVTVARDPWILKAEVP